MPLPRLANQSLSDYSPSLGAYVVQNRGKRALPPATTGARVENTLAISCLSFFLTRTLCKRIAVAMQSAEVVGRGPLYVGFLMLDPRRHSPLKLVERGVLILLARLALQHVIREEPR